MVQCFCLVAPIATCKLLRRSSRRRAACQSRHRTLYARATYRLIAAHHPRPSISSGARAYLLSWESATSNSPSKGKIADAALRRAALATAFQPPGLPLRGPKLRHPSASGRRPAVVHGTLSEINRFVFASSAESLKAAELELAGCDGVIGGHSGLPFTEVIGGRLWHNAGVIGRPANDGTRRTWYSILTRTRAGDAIEIEHCALTYRAA
jgi:hypothetical protein